MIRFFDRPRLLTDAEIDEIRGGQDDTIVVTGRRYGGGVIFTGYADYGTGLEPHPTLSPDGGGGFATPPDLGCRDTSQMTPEELLDYRISQEAARVASEIMTKPDKDLFEYGAIVYRDLDGTIRHTPVVRGGPTGVQTSTQGMVNWGQALGIVHSHPGGQFDPQFPDFKRYPTPNAAMANGQGDWYVFDQIVNTIRTSLETDYNMSAAEANDQTALFRQYVLGPSGPAGTDQCQLHGYDTNDRDMDTLGQKVDLNLGLCP